MDQLCPRSDTSGDYRLRWPLKGRRYNGEVRELRMSEQDRFPKAGSAPRNCRRDGGRGTDCSARRVNGVAGRRAGGTVAWRIAIIPDASPLTVVLGCIRLTTRHAERAAALCRHGNGAQRERYGQHHQQDNSPESVHMLTRSCQTYDLKQVPSVLACLQYGRRLSARRGRYPTHCRGFQARSRSPKLGTPRPVAGFPGLDQPWLRGRSGENRRRHIVLARMPA